MFNCEKYLFELQTELIEQRYHPQPYKYFVIREPKERVISVAAFRDRVVHHALVNIIESYFEAVFIKDSYATRKAKGLHLAVTAAQSYACRYEWYLKLDIEKFFYQCQSRYPAEADQSQNQRPRCDVLMPDNPEQPDSEHGIGRK